MLCVDIDPQGNTSSGLGVRVSEEMPTVYEVLTGEKTAAQAAQKTCVDTLFLIPSDTRLAGAEVELVSVQKREFVLRDALSAVRDQYDFIFIDCPPSLSLITVNSLCAADSVLVPIQCEYYALEGVSALMDTVSRVQKYYNRRLSIEGVVLTMLDARTNLGLQVVQEVKKYFKGKVFGSVIPRNVRLGEAPSHGLPIHLYDPRSSGAEAYGELADEFLERNRGKRK